MIEGGRPPCRCRVARRAVLRKASGHVIRIRRALEVRQVARGASGRCSRVTPIHVALRAGGIDVCAGERKARQIVIERSRTPRRRAMAHAAGLRDSRGDVVRIRSAVEVVQVAGSAIRAQAGVITVDVAGGARLADVRAGQREARGGMVKLRALPGGCGVTLLAGLRETACDVVRIRRAIEIVDVAGCAVLRRACKSAVHMALRARHIHVRTSEGELRQGVVVKLCALPRGRRVAARAVLRESGVHVIRIRRRTKFVRMTTEAIGRSAGVAPAGVTRGAVELRVRAGECKSCVAGVVKPRAHPRVHGVAGLAGSGERCRFVIRIGGALESVAMAGEALRGESDELSDRSALVTLIAIGHRVRANQRETILVLFHFRE